MTKSKRHPVGISPQLENLLAGRAGVEGCLPGMGELIRELAASVRALSDGYADPRQCDWSALYGNAAALRAYFLYYLPVNLVKLFPVMEELVTCGAFDVLRRPAISVLDIGCGPGTFMLGLLEYIRKACAQGAAAPQKISLTGIDRTSGSLAAAENLIREYLATGCLPSGVDITFLFRHGSILETNFLRSGQRYDLIIAGNVLAELPDSALVPCLERAASRLADGGALIIIDPGTRRAARRLLEIRQLLLEKPGLRLCAPCLRAGECPLENDREQWCHEKLFWQPTEAVRRIDGLLGFTKQKGVKFSFLAFVKTDAAPLTVGGRENVWRVSSYVIRNKGEERLWLCNGRERRLLRLLDRNRSDTNSDFARAERGDHVVIDGAEPRASFYDLPKKASFSILTS